MEPKPILEPTIEQFKSWSNDQQLLWIAKVVSLKREAGEHAWIHQLIQGESMWLIYDETNCAIEFRFVVYQGYEVIRVTTLDEWQTLTNFSLS